METLSPILIVILFTILLIRPPRKSRVWIVIVGIVAIGFLVSDISFVFHALLGNTYALFVDFFVNYDAVVTLAISCALALLSYWLVSKSLSKLFENSTVTAYTSWFIAGTIAGLSVYWVRTQFVLYAARKVLDAQGLSWMYQNQNQSTFSLRNSALLLLLTSISGGCAGIVISRYRSIKGYAIWGVIGLTLGFFFQFHGPLPHPIRQPDHTILVAAHRLAPTVGAALLLIVCNLIGKRDVVTGQKN